MLDRIIRNVGMQFIDINTAVIRKDGVDVAISISTVSSCTCVCVSVPLPCRKEDEDEIDRRVAMINDSSFIPLGYYWHDRRHQELQLRVSLLVDTKPTEKSVEDILNQMIAPAIATARMLSGKEYV